MGPKELECNGLRCCPLILSIERVDLHLKENLIYELQETLLLRTYHGKKLLETALKRLGMKFYAII
jgi:hypothetical protein